MRGGRPRRAAPRSDRPGVRAARVSASASGTRRFTRDARARGLEGAAPRHADRQRHRRPDDAAAQEGRRRRRRATDSHGAGCRASCCEKASHECVVSRVDSRPAHRLVRRRADAHAGRLRHRHVSSPFATSSRSSSTTSCTTTSRRRKASSRRCRTAAWRGPAIGITIPTTTRTGAAMSGPPTANRSAAPAHRLCCRPFPLAAAGAQPRYESIVAGGRALADLRRHHARQATSVVLRVSRSEERLRGQLREVLIVLVLGLPLVVALAGVGGYHPRAAGARADRSSCLDAQRITAERLHERLSAPNPDDEIGRLTTVINDTFARLESSFDQAAPLHGRRLS